MKQCDEGDLKMDFFFAHKRYSTIDFLIGGEAGPFSVIFWWWV
jgi:hypothetical protein